jgi:acetyltransferase-like isoleucine patch superfamily enzyme
MNLAPVRWFRSLTYLAQGVRLSPTAMVWGRPAQLKLGAGTKIGARSRVDLRGGGLFVTGSSVWLNYDVEIETSSELRIGAGTTIQRRAMLNGAVRLGAGCVVGPNVFLSSGSHAFRNAAHLPIREQERSSAGERDRPIRIQDDCWLGVNAVILPGVTLGKGSIVGANAVVSRDVAPYAIVAGVPARQIGARLDWRPPLEIRADRPEDLVYVLSEFSVVRLDGEFALRPVWDGHFRAALANSGQLCRARIDYVSRGNCRIRHNGVVFALRAGRGSFDLEVTSAGDGPAILEFDILSEGDDPEAVGGVRAVAIVEAH